MNSIHGITERRKRCVELVGNSKFFFLTKKSAETYVDVIASKQGKNKIKLVNRNP